MTAYFAPRSEEAIDSGLNSFLKQLVDTYSTLDWAMDTAVSSVSSGTLPGFSLI